MRYKPMNRTGGLVAVMIIILIVALSCTKSGDRTLELANSIMEENPDSAMSLLSPIEYEIMDDLSDNALRNLLITQAKVKTGVEIDNDSIIRTAAEFYERSGPDSLYMRSQFYLGGVRSDLGEISRSVVPAMVARQLAVKLGDLYWRAKASELIADIYRKRNNFHEAVNMRKEAVEFYKLARKHRNSLYSLCDLGYEYAVNYNSSEAVRILDSIACIAKNDGDVDLLNYCNDYRYFACYLDEDYKKAKDVLLEYQSLSGSGLLLIDTIVEAHLDLMLGETRRADSIFSSAMPKGMSGEERAQYFILRDRYYRMKGEERFSVESIDSLLKLQNESLVVTLKDEVTIEYNDYLGRKNKEQADRIGFIQQRDVLIGVVLVLIITIIVMGFVLRIRAKNARVRELMTNIVSMTESANAISKHNEKLEANYIHLGKEVRKLSDIMTEKDKRYDRLSEQVEKLLKSGWRRIEKICYDIILEGETEDNAEMRRCYKGVVKELNKMFSNENLRKLEIAIDDNFDGIMTNLRRECPFLTKDEIKFVLLTYAGVSPRLIGFVLKISYVNVFNRKRRIAERILRSGVKDASSFAGMLR